MRRLAALTAGLAAVALLAACSGGSDGPRPSGGPGTSSASGGSLDATGSPAVSPGVSGTPSAIPAESPFFVDPGSAAYAAWQAASGDDKELLARIALTPGASWVTEADPAAAAAGAAAYLEGARAAGATGLLVLYGIPDRDCGSYSRGGTTAETYAAWVRAVADVLTPGTWVVLEPDALANIGDCSSRELRLGLLRQAAQDLAAAGGRVYVDAGNARWLPAEEAAARLREVGVGGEDVAVGTKGGSVRGFALNVSNYVTTDESLEYARAVAAALGGGHAIIDTSRNGRGSDGTWCNPPGRGLGASPRLLDDPVADALVWVKLPGESDGECNGGPSAGAWWPAQALQLARDADLTSAWAFREPAQG